VNRLSVGLLGALLVATLWHLGLLDVPLLVRGGRNISLFVTDMFPPDTAVIPTVAWAMVETVEIAFAGTLLGFGAALPLALLSTPVVGGRATSTALRAALAFVRTVPSLLWAIIFVVAVGLGPAAGTLGLALYSLGYLGKLLYEAFDGVDPEVIEATRAVGASRLQLARHAVLPETAHIVLAQLLFVFEYNVRASSILGFVGAGGVGFYLLGYLQALQYERLATALLITFLVVVTIDAGSTRLRQRFMLPTLRA
jgi:phosphonate transport system permease protein